MNQKRSIIFWTIFVCLVFFGLLVTDTTPYLRGFADWPFQWRWGYYYIPTWIKLWAPSGVFLLLCWAYLTNCKNIFLIFSLSILWQVSLLYFGRSGIFVLVSRIIQPDANGYFTAAIHTTNFLDLIRNYPQKLLTFSQHARVHPPLAILPFWLVNKFFELVDIPNNFAPKTEGIKVIWQTLTNSQRNTAILGSILAPVLSSFAIFPLFYWAKKLGKKTALTSLFFFILLPSLSLFLPLNDTFLPIFSCSVLLLISLDKFFWAGILAGIGTLFSFSLLPVWFFCLISNIKNVNKTIKFSFAFLGIFLIMNFVFGFDILKTSTTIFSGTAKRDYLPWLFFGPLDFFIFSLIPISIAFFASIKNYSKSLLLLITILILDLSGASPAENGRILITLSPILIVYAVDYLEKHYKFNKKDFLIFFALGFVQIILMTEFWVTLW